MRPRVALSIASALVLTATVACRGDPPFPGGRIPAGAWGGDHALLLVSDSGAVLEFDCAAGAIPGVLGVDDDGRFTWAGSYVVGHGGPIRQDEPPDVRPAAYLGETNGRAMTLRVHVNDGSVPALEFHLDRGRDARVFKCL